MKVLRFLYESTSVSRTVIYKNDFKLILRQPLMKDTIHTTPKIFLDVVNRYDETDLNHY